MKVGDLVSYYNCDAATYVAVVLWINEAGGTVKVLLTNGKIGWLVKSGCEVV
jgi:hypothetical protein